MDGSQWNDAPVRKLGLRGARAAGPLCAKPMPPAGATKSTGYPSTPDGGVPMAVDQAQTVTTGSACAIAAYTGVRAIGAYNGRAMPRAFVLPDLGEGLTEAEIRQGLVREGDVVREDAPLLEVETDKATVEIPSPIGGRVERIHVAPGQTVKVGQVLVTFGDGGAATGKQAADTLDPTRTPAPEPRTLVTDAGAARQTTSAPARPTGPVPATPATRRLARE